MSKTIKDLLFGENNKRAHKASPVEVKSIDPEHVNPIEPLKTDEPKVLDLEVIGIKDLNFEIKRLRKSLTKEQKIIALNLQTYMSAIKYILEKDVGLYSDQDIRAEIRKNVDEFYSKIE